MAFRKAPPPPTFTATSAEEPNLYRAGLAGVIASAHVPELRAVRLRHDAATCPALVVDEGIVSMDAAAYGVLVQWAYAARNRNVGWAFATQLDGAARAFQMAGLPPGECIFPDEATARAALDRGSGGQRVLKPAPSSLALEGLRNR